jgi:hypothetical protein
MNTDHQDLERLKMLQGWIDFVFEALTVDPGPESKRFRQLEKLIGAKGLRDLREQSFSLRARFQTLIVEGESRAQTVVREAQPVA